MRTCGLLLGLLSASVLPLVAAGQEVEATLSTNGSRQVSPPPLELHPQVLKVQRAGIYSGDLRELPNTKPRIRVRPERGDPPVQRGMAPTDAQPPVRAPEPPTLRAPAPSPLSSFLGLDFTNFGAGRPPDTVGDVGPTHFIQSVNSSLGIYRKSDGVRLVGISLDTFFSQGNFGNLCDTDNFGDPVVLYDTFEERWIITDFAFQVDGSGNVVNPPGMFQCFAASRTSDPVSGGWNFYSINTEGGLGDYGKFGIWPDGLYSTFNMFDYAATGGFQSARVYAMNKAQMYAGEAEVQLLRFDLPSEFTVLPANARLQTGTPPAGAPNPYAVVWNFYNVISVYKLQANWNALSTSTFTGPFDSTVGTSWADPPATVPAMGGNANDTLGPRLMMQNQYTRLGGVESLWNTHTVQGSAATRSAVRYYQLVITGGTVAASPAQAFTHVPDNTNRYMSSLALDRLGNMLLGYSTSSSSARPAIKYAGRLVGDPVNSLPQTEVSLIDGTGSQNTSNRWGDYATMTLDPDGCTFWLTSEYYIATGGNWQTRWGSTRYPTCTTIGTGTLSGTVTNSAGGAPIAGATVTLGSRTTTTNGSGQYSFSSLPAGTYPSESAAAAGFGSSSATALVVNAGATTTQNFSLTAQAAAACFTDTSQADFQTGIPQNVDLTGSPGNVRLAAPSSVDQQNLSVTTSGFGFTSTSWVAQTFQPTVSGTLTRVDVNLFCSNCTGTTPNLTVSIRATTGDLPTGADLASGTITGFSSGAGGYFPVTFAAPPTVTAGTRYAIVVRAVSNPSAGTYAYVVSTGSPYANGRRATSTNSGGTWTGQTDDIGFITYINAGFSASGNQTSSRKSANPATGQSAYWTTLSWNATVPANTTLRYQVAGSTSTSGPWNYVGPDGTTGTFFTTSGASLSQFNGYDHLRYRAFLSTTNSTATPLLADVTVCHSNSATGTADEQGLQVGAATLPSTVAGPNRVTRISYNRPFLVAPVVIVQPSDENPDPVALRVVNVDRSGFDVLQVESPGCTGCTGLGATTSIHWLAAAPGSYRLRQDQSIPRPDGVPLRGTGPGPLIKVGTITTSATQRNTASGFTGWPANSWQAVSYPGGEAFATTPVVLTTVQSWNNEGPNLNGPTATLGGASQIWATAVSNNVTTSGFDVALEASEVDDDDFTPAGPNVAETIGYVALQRSVSTLLTPLGGGANVGLATGNGTATDSCAAAVLSGLAFPSGPPVLANLRGFAGKQSRTDADGGWLRRCAMTTPGGNAVSMTIRVDEDADIDAERAHATAEGFGAAIFGGDFVTTPITLAQTRVQRVGSLLQVDFSSATEVAHLGYRIWGRSAPEAEWQLLSEQTQFSKRGDQFDGTSYQVQVAAPAITEIRIEDIDIRGRSRFHPAVAVGTDVGAASVRQPLDWTAIRAANARVAIRPAGASGSPRVQAAVVRAGVQRVRYEDLSAAGFPSGADAAAIAVTDEGRPVLRHVECPGSTFGPGCVVEWLGQPRQSLYGADNQYTVQVDPRSARAVTGGALASSASGLRVGTVEIVQAPNRGYSFSAPGNDPWYDERLLATSAAVETSRSFALPERAPGPVKLTLELWGGLDFDAEAPDHSVQVLLNGQLVASRRFDGLTLEAIELDLVEAQLAPQNTLTVRVPADTGFSADVVLLDGFRVQYPRFSRGTAGELVMGNMGTTLQIGQNPLLLDGFEDRPGFQVEGALAGSVLWTTAKGIVRRDPVLASGPLAVADAVDAFHLAAPAQWQSPALRLAAGAPTIGTTDYLVVTHPLFADELAPLIALQQQRGYSVRVLRTDEIYAGYSDGEANPLAIRMAIADVRPRFVLLVGGDSYDYHDYLGLGSQSLLPTFYRVADPVVRFAASDFAYADADGDGSPEFALGRLPARTVDELRRALASLTERAAQLPTRWFASAGVSGAGERFALHSHSVLSPLRAGQQREYSLVDEVGLDIARTDLRAALTGSADWINYLGHSGPNRWAFQNLLDTSQLGTVSRTGAPAIVSQFGCWSSYFVLPTQDTMSAALQLRSNRLAAAVIGSTGLAEDASHLALATRLFDLVEDGVIEGHDRKAGNTIGELLMEAKRNLFQRAPEHLESNWSITLFGDPAMPVR